MDTILMIHGENRRCREWAKCFPKHGRRRAQPSWTAPRLNAAAFGIATADHGRRLPESRGAVGDVPHGPVAVLEVADSVFRLRDADMPQLELRKIRLHGADLTGASLRHLGLTDATFTDCVLRDADLTHFRTWRCTFTDCDLSGAVLTDAVLSSRHRGTGTTWRNCTFNEVTLDGVVAEGGDFEGCVFERVRMANMVFNGCAFTDCRITGVLDNVTFTGANQPAGTRPVTIANLDLRDCRLSNVGFAGLRLSGVLLPPRDSLAVVPGATKVLAEIRSAIARDPGEHEFLEFWAGYKLKHHTPDDDLFLDYEYLRESAGESGVALVREAASRAS
jgi:uncharacterized protein YjbI with pentapeptide repeats